jgi:hypothetical protein
MLKFNGRYLILAILLFIVEILIALYSHDQFIRPYIGDVLVVVFLYCLMRAFIRTSTLTAAIVVLVFSFLVETLQYFHFVELIGLEKSPIASIVIGNYFAWADLLAYTIGIIIVLICEQLKTKKFKVNGLEI